ncbi:MAG: hypothetical protein II956_13545 [Bacteroidales bacterium]|nr:hypothetical protein [Bacteroidales bacterium]
MKKTIFIPVIAALTIYACGGGQQNQTAKNTDTTVTVNTDVAADTDVAQNVPTDSVPDR